MACSKTIPFASSIRPVDAYWKFEEVGAVSRVDSLIGLAIGLVGGSTVPTNAAGIIGQGVFFDHTTLPEQLYGAVGAAHGGVTWDHLTYAASAGASMSFWVHVPATNNCTFFVDFSVQDLVGDFQGGFHVQTIGPNNFQLKPYDGNGNYTAAIDLGTLTPNSWNHIVCVYNQMTSVASAFVNGVAVLFTSAVGVPWLVSASAALQIEMVASVGVDFTLDELGWWKNTVLAQGDVTALYNAGVGARPPNVP